MGTAQAGSRSAPRAMAPATSPIAAASTPESTNASLHDVTPVTACTSDPSTGYPGRPEFGAFGRDGYWSTAWRASSPPFATTRWRQTYVGESSPTGMLQPFEGYSETNTPTTSSTPRTVATVQATDSIRGRAWASGRTGRPAGRRSLSSTSAGLAQASHDCTAATCRFEGPPGGGYRWSAGPRSSSVGVAETSKVRPLRCRRRVS